MTEAQKRATKKWEDKHEMISFRAAKGTREKLKKIAKKRKISFNNLIIDIINKEIKGNIWEKM